MPESFSPSQRRRVDDRFCGWPDRRTLGTFVWVGLAGACWFVVIFVSTDLVTARRALRVPIHLEAEQRIPFVPAAVWLYMTMYALFLMAPFVLRSPRKLMALGSTHAAIVFVAGISFLAVPAQLAYPTTIGVPERGVTATLYRLADWLNLDYNLLPSLHVALSVSCVAVYQRRAGATGRLVLWCWALAVALSTIFTHFHHVLDAVSGFALGLAGAHNVYHRIAASQDGNHGLR